MPSPKDDIKKIFRHFTNCSETKATQAAEVVSKDKEVYNLLVKSALSCIASTAFVAGGGVIVVTGNPIPGIIIAGTAGIKAKRFCNEMLYRGTQLGIVPSYVKNILK